MQGVSVSSTDLIRVLDVGKDVVVILGVIGTYTKVVRLVSRFEMAINMMWEDYCNRHHMKYTPLTRKSFGRSLI